MKREKKPRLPRCSIGIGNGSATKKNNPGQLREGIHWLVYYFYSLGVTKYYVSKQLRA